MSDSSKLLELRHSIVISLLASWLICCCAPLMSKLTRAQIASPFNAYGTQKTCSGCCTTFDLRGCC